MFARRWSMALVAGWEDTFRDRTVRLIGEEAAAVLRDSTVAVAGCGGVGGGAALTLARMGVEGFILADPCPFDAPDMNRQWGAFASTLGKNKALVYKDLLLSINPACRVRTFTEGVTEENVEEFLEGADVLVDCIDISVPGEVRKRMFACAQRKGIYGVFAPVIGFGCLLVSISPDGLPVDLVASYTEGATEEARLPGFLSEFFVKEHIERTNAIIGRHRVPSVAVSPALGSSLVAAECVVILAGASLDGWRPPSCLPFFRVVDLLRGTDRKVSLFSVATGDVGSDERKVREAALKSAGYNLLKVPPSLVKAEMYTDSWSEIGVEKGEQEVEGGEDPVDFLLEDALHGVYGCSHVFPVYRGRLAEAVLACVLAAGRRGKIACTPLFPTLRFHLESRGFEVEEIPVAEALDVSSDFPFKGNVDTARLASMAASGDVVGVVVELCNNALGGQPVSLANLQEVKEICERHGIPLVLDVTRGMANAVLLREREPACGGMSVAGILRRCCSLASACVGSFTKEFKVSCGGFVGVNDAGLFVGVRDAVKLGFGDCFSVPLRAEVCRSMREDPAGPSLRRREMVKRLYRLMEERGLPVVRPDGGHAVFLDLGRFRSEDGDTLIGTSVAAAMFVEGGVRSSENFATPLLRRGGIRMLRLAVPVDMWGEDADMPEVVADAALEVWRRRRTLVRLSPKSSRPEGLVGVLMQEFSPVE